MLAERGLPAIDRVRYQEIFGFPVIDYYGRAGFTFETETYESVAAIYNERYMNRARTCPLFPDAVAALDKLSGLRQIVLSAAETALLLSQIEPFGIAEYFEKIIGQDNVYAHGKTDAALHWMHEEGIDPASAVLIGDTTHDSDVARALGCGCVLVPNGHHDRARLSGCGCHIAASLTEAAEWIIGGG